MKKLTFYLISVCLFLGMTTGNIYATEFAGGDGTSPETAYEIADVEQLDLLRENNKGVYYKLIADIDLSEIDNWEPIGNTTVAFEGKINGNGYKFLNVKINRPDTDNVGLFGRTMGDIGATVFENITIEGADIKGKNLVGTLVGRANAIVINCKAVNVKVEGESSVGGLVGELSANACMEKCGAEGEVTATGDRVGGLVGYVSNNTEGIKTSWALVDVTGNTMVGGLVGYAYNGGDYGLNWLTITDCHAGGDVTGNNSVGGFIGHSAATTINNCAASGKVTGGTAAGGFIGTAKGVAGTSANLRPVIISNCYASGDVESDSKMVGGFMGEATRLSPGNPLTITSCFSKGSVSGGENTSAFIGHAHGETTVSKNVIVAGKVQNGSVSKFRLVGYPVATTDEALTLAAAYYTENYILENLEYTPTSRPNPDTNYLSMDGDEKSEAELKMQSFYDALGWEMEEGGPWQMNTGYGNDGYPILKLIYVEKEDPGTGTKVQESGRKQTFVVINAGNIIIESKTGIQVVNLLDLNGRIVNKYPGNDLRTLIIPAGSLSRGTYILSVQQDTGTDNFKILY
ncbi:MAG: T9SS type A sorting domain-containing protein [Candidatus Azobacteroides sp.]|nr:T9SS type A sorting domain-containing protein [Candidatus Azobacteroides sp.]